jgi:hypothetical protein
MDGMSTGSRLCSPRAAVASCIADGDYEFLPRHRLGVGKSLLVGDMCFHMSFLYRKVPEAAAQRTLLNRMWTLGPRSSSEADQCFASGWRSPSFP